MATISDVARLIGVLAFGEHFTALTAAGMALVIAAVSSVVLNGASPAPKPAARPDTDEGGQP